MASFRRATASLLVLLTWCPLPAGAAGAQAPVLPTPRPATLPPWLPRYDLDVHLDPDCGVAEVRQRVTWTNRHSRPADELVFNVHSSYAVPKEDIGLLAKTLEILRISPSEALGNGGAGQVTAVSLADAGAGPPRPLPFAYQQAIPTALEVRLARPVAEGESVTIDLDFRLWLPQKFGRWGRWEGVTFLSNWLPVLAYYDEQGWQPTPFVPWHQPFFNEAGNYRARVSLPRGQKVACTGTVQSVTDTEDGRQQVEVRADGVRDFAFLCSARYQEFTGTAGPVRVRCLAFPEHEHHARNMVRIACEALDAYGQWFGPYPYPDFTIAESFFGWNGNECATLVMIDERVFGMPHLADGYIDYLLSHEVCHQWWYNVVGTNGYAETWMDEGLATYFSHRLLNQKRGRNNPLLRYPRGLEWLPNIRRENYRYYGLYGTIGRHEAGPCVRDMDRFDHIVNLFTMCYDKGGKVVGMIEDRLGEAAFLDFMRQVYARYQFRVLRVADFQRELEEYTGRHWEEFFQRWVYGPGLSDWCVETVDVREKPAGRRPLLLRRKEREPTPCEVTVLLRQKAEYSEQTVLGIRLDESETYQVRIPILPQVGTLELDEPPARVECLADNLVRVTVTLPCRPTQIAVDPDQVLVDRDPANNFWKPPVRRRWTPLYTVLDETDLTNDYDRWNVLAGPWFFASAYNDPWYTRSTMFGVRAGVYRTQQFAGGVYAAYRTNFRDLVVGADGLRDHWPWPHTQVGFNVEQRLTSVYAADQTANRAAVFGRYVLQYGDSLYLPPMHYVEAFADTQDNFLPNARRPLAGAERFDRLTTGGVHYHINYLTPYWDPEGGFQLDATYQGGMVKFRDREGVNQLQGQLSFVKAPPAWLGPLAQTRLAGRLFGAAGLPDKGEYFALGGSDRFRGFDMAERQGSVVWVASVEWRVPLWKGCDYDVLDHTVGFRNVYGAAFYDVGDALANGRSADGVVHAVGAGLRVDVALFSFVERGMIRFDVAKAVNAASPWQFWFGFMHPF